MNPDISLATKSGHFYLLTTPTSLLFEVLSQAVKLETLDTDENIESIFYSQPKRHSDWNRVTINSVTHVNVQQPTDRLITLRANLRHFDESPDFGDGIDVIEIRSMILNRIAEADSTLRLEPASVEPAPVLYPVKTAA